MFRFANPFALLLLVIPVMLFLAWRFVPGLRGKSTAFRFSDIRFMESLPGTWRVGLFWLPDALRLAAWVVLVLIIARPQSGQQLEVIRGQGIDIVIALDISISMEADDIRPTRLEGAKAQIEQFVQGREFDRVGLVVFASDAFHYVPPTLDYDFYTDRLGEVQLVTDYGLEGQGTAIGTGIASAANMLRDSEASSKIIILLTDGSNNSGNVDPLDAARAATALDIRIYTIGMGRSVRTADGQLLSGSDFDESSLETIAELSDGLYFRAQDIAGLQRTYQQIDALERSDIERQVFVNWREQSAVLIGLCLILLLLERTLRHTVFQSVP